METYVEEMQTTVEELPSTSTYVERTAPSIPASDCLTRELTEVRDKLKRLTFPNERRYVDRSERNISASDITDELLNMVDKLEELNYNYGRNIRRLKRFVMATSKQQVYSR